MGTNQKYRGPLALNGMLWILSWNCQSFPWNRGPKLSQILNENVIILLVETWEHGESKVPTI